MRALLVDIGNTRIKWARFDGDRLGRQRAAPFAGWQARDFARVVIGGGRDIGTAKGVGAEKGIARITRRIDRIVVSSVAGSRVNRMFTQAARLAGAPAPELVTSRRRAGGVTTAYIEPWRLGVDRFVMAIGAHRQARRRAVCIVSVGTALTIDLVDASGLHRGGAIVPSPLLMVNSLLSQTSGIRRRAGGGRTARRGGSNGQSGPEAGGLRGRHRGTVFARTTRSAIEQGALLAAAAAIDRGVEEARLKLGLAPVVMLTGGGAAAVAPLVRSTYVSVPDLVLQGLAVLAGEGMPPSGKT